MRLFVYLEDIAQERFICGIIKRLATERSVNVSLEVRNARGGAPVMLSKFKEALKRWVDELPSQSVIIVCKDTNCKRGSVVKREFANLLRECEGRGICLILALPEPHIERWYLLDQNAFREATGVPLRGAPSGGLCRRGRRKRAKDYYKKFIADAARERNIRLTQNGAEFGEEIADALNIQTCRQDDNFGDFIQQVERIFS